MILTGWLGFALKGNTDTGRAGRGSTPRVLASPLSGSIYAWTRVGFWDSGTGKMHAGPRQGRSGTNLPKEGSMTMAIDSANDEVDHGPWIVRRYQHHHVL